MLRWNRVKCTRECSGQLSRWWNDQGQNVPSGKFVAEMSTQDIWEYLGKLGGMYGECLEECQGRILGEYLVKCLRGMCRSPCRITSLYGYRLTRCNEESGKALGLKNGVGRININYNKNNITRCSAIAERPRCSVRYSFRQK